MYCPRCGETLAQGPSGGLVCVRGRMEYSRHIEAELTQCFVDRVRVPSSAPLPTRVGGSWFCPGCGVAMVEREQGLVVCPECDLSLGEFIVELVELHPHS